MPVLCIDIGNTSVHYAIVKDRQITISGAVPTKGIDAEGHGVLEVLQHHKGSIDGVCYCSVVPRATPVLVEALRATQLEGRSFHLTCYDCPGLPIHYPKPEEVGQDRLALGIGAQALYGAPVVAIDMGTAVTLDIVTEAGYEGGIIAPGLEVMTRYLHEQTALLPLLDPNDLMVSTGIGKTTVEAMKLGCAVGFQGMIRALLDRVMKELQETGSPKPSIVATGGSAGILPQQWIGEIAYVPDLPLIGLAEAWNRKQKQR